MNDVPAQLPVAVIVLAAGLGRRLDQLGTEVPKWLAPVAGRCVADYQLDAIEQATGPGDPLLVVGGHRVEAIDRWLGSRSTDLDLEVVRNTYYAELNNWYSLLVALRRLHERDWPGSLVVLNGDLCARPAWYGQFFREVGKPRRRPAMLAVDFERPLTEEAMKVAVRPDESGDRICTRIGKSDVPDPVGEYVGMAGFDVAGWRLLAATLEEFVGNPERADEWYEAAFQRLMTDRLLFCAWPTVDSGWVEIDDPTDWAAASRLMTPVGPCR